MFFKVHMLYFLLRNSSAFREDYYEKQRLENLTIKDNFLFGAVMMNEDNCKGLLERALDIKIDYVRVSREKV